MLFARRHQYFRTGISTILIILSKYVINKKNNGYEIMDRIDIGHGRVMSCSLAQKKWVARMFNHTSLAGNSSGADTVPDKVFKLFSDYM